MKSRSAFPLLLSVSLLCFLACTVSLQAANPRGLVVMTQNIYQGSELEHVAAATTLNEYLFGVATDYSNVAATNFAERADAMAAEISANPPALIGLQEVALWRTGPSSFPPVTANAVSYDFLQILLDALAARGLHYKEVRTQANWDVQGTGFFSFGFMDARLTERTAIIARTDLPTSELQLSNPLSAPYSDATALPVFGGGSLRLNGSWVSVDAKVRGKTIRFITTHLDPFNPFFRARQVQEILAGPANTDLPVVLTGDLNSTTATEAYALLMSAGFIDTWSNANSSDPGLTCCQVPPDTIVNPVSQLTERVDYVLTRGGLDVLSSELIGSDPADRTLSGLWPSDHAGILTSLRIGH